MLITNNVTIKGKHYAWKQKTALSHILTLSPSLWHILSTHCLQVLCVPKPDRSIPLSSLGTDPLFVAIVGGWISFVVYASLDGSARPSYYQIIQKILNKGTRFKFGHELWDPLLLSILTTEPSRIIERGLMQSSYRNTVSVGAKSYMLQFSPWASPSNLSLWEY